MTETKFSPGPRVETITPLPTPEQAPKRRGRPPGSKNTGSTIRRSLQPQIASSLLVINFAIMAIPGLRNDALDESEIVALSKAIDEQAKNSVRFRRMLEGALTATSGGQLLGVIVIIGARRAARHGFIPQEMDGMLGSMIAAQDKNVGTS